MAKHYSEEEAAEILRNAARMQDATGRSSQTGLDADELRRIAAEAGIAPEFLERALQQPRSNKAPINLGFGDEFTYEIDRSLPDDAIREMVSEINSVVKVTLPQEIGFTRKMTVTGGTVYGQLEIVRKGDRTTLKFRQTPLIAYFAGLHLPLILGLILGLIFTVEKQWLQALLLGPALILTGFGLFWFMAKNGRQRADKAWNEIVARVDRVAQNYPETAQTESALRTTLESAAPDLRQSL